MVVQAGLEVDELLDKLVTAASGTCDRLLLHQSSVRGRSACGVRSGGHSQQRENPEWFEGDGERGNFSGRPLGRKVLVAAEQVRIGVGEHVVQFYERDDDLVATVAPYLLAALLRDEVAVVIAVEPHLAAFEAALQAAGLDLSELARRRRYLALDATVTLSLLRPEGWLDRDRFDSVVGGTLRRLGADGRPIRVYGDMVGILWEAGDVPAAVELEILWTDLGQEIAFSLLCAYQGAYVSGTDSSGALGGFCHLHTAVVHAGGTEASRRFRPEPRAPGAARRYVVERLSRWGHDEELCQRAGLVVTELTTNAVLHARSPFIVTVRAAADEVAITVADASPEPPVLGAFDPLAQSGRGLLMVDAVADRWGTVQADEGKLVWAAVRR